MALVARSSRTATTSGVHNTQVVSNSTPSLPKRYFRTSFVSAGEMKVINTPTMADSISEGELGRWEKKVGDYVKRDELIGVIETDKVTIDITAPESGYIRELFAEAKTIVKKGEPLYRLEVSSEAPAGSAAKPAAAAPAAAPAPEKPAAKAEKPKETPQAAAPAPAASKPAPSATPSTSSSSSTSSTASSGNRTEHREKMNRMRLRIAERLKDSQNTAAMLTTFNEIDMTNIIQLRNDFKDEFLKKHNVKLGFMSAFVRGAVAALQEQPIVNAVIDGTDIIHRDYIDISVAVATPKGLVVPVLRNCEALSFAGVEKAIAALGEKARNNQIALEDMAGGTFTISNGGVYGSLMGTPIINPPQSAILGMHGIFDRPVAVKGKIEIRPMMYVALTYDHRLIDGREAVTFLRKIKSTVEDPRTLLLDL